MSEIRERAAAWCREDRGYLGRMILLAYGAFVLFKILRNEGPFTPLDFLNLGIHELGHIVCMPFGEWIGIAGGSIAQELPLANLFGGDPVHDWNYLLGHAHALARDAQLAGAVRFFAFISTLYFLWTGTWLIWRIMAARWGKGTSG